MAIFRTIMVFSLLLVLKHLSKVFYTHDFAFIGPADGVLAEWRARIESQPWSEAFVFFKHEDEGKGPKFAREFLGVL